MRMQARHFQSGDGQHFCVGLMSMTFKTTAAHDWSACTVCEAIEPPKMDRTPTGEGVHVKHRVFRHRD